MPLSVEVVSCPTRLSSRGIQLSDVLQLKVTLIIKIIHTQKKERGGGQKGHNERRMRGLMMTQVLNKPLK